MKTITNLAASNIRKNRTRSILIVISIFLTTLLIQIIASFGTGMIRYNRANAGKLYGNYSGTFSRVSEEQYEIITKRSEFIGVGRVASVAEVEQKDVKMGLICTDTKGAENVNLFDQIKEGKLPQKENEIAASVEFFSQFGLSNPNIGDSVTISLRSDKRSKFVDKEFVICGILISSEQNNLQKAYQGYVSELFYEDLVSKEMRSYNVTFRLDESIEMNGDVGEDVLKELAILCGIKEDNVKENFMYLMWVYDPGTETLFICIGISLIVILVSIVVIYNIFQVGIVQKIQEYGKIKALGATKKQLKRIIFREGMFLAFIGVPLGILFGTGLASIMFQQFTKNGLKIVTTSNLVQVSVLSIPVLLLIMFISFLTVWFALKKPMRVVAAISPVEAIRYQENTSSKRTVRKGKKKISVLNMTISNLSANRRRTVSTILTMGLSCVLFVALSNVAGNIDIEYEARKNIEYGKFSIELDCSLSDKAYPENNLNEIQKNNPLGNEFQEKLKEIPGVTEVSVRYIFAVENHTFSSLDEEGNLTTVCVMNQEDFKRYTKRGSTKGNTNYQQVAKEDGIIFGYSYFLEEEGYHLEQNMEMSVLDAGVKVPFKGKIMGAFGAAPASWVITEETFKKLNVKGELVERLWVDCKEENKKEVEAAIHNLMLGMSHVEMKTYDNAVATVMFSTSVMQSGIYGILAILGIISFMNMANTIITGVITRKRELGVLQAVGMTNHQLNQMLQLEGILFSVGTIIVSLLVGCPFGYEIFQYAKQHSIYGMNEYHVPILEIGIMMAVIILMQVVLSFLLSRNLRKESLVERINYQG